MATKKTVEPMRYWLSYDLGIRGNYEALYEWLDSNGAKECGDSLATFKSKKTPEQLKRDLLDTLGDTGKVRIYLVDRSRGIGLFLIGKRKAAPWAGFSLKPVGNALDE